MTAKIFLLMVMSLTVFACAPQEAPPNPQDQRRQQLSLEQDRLNALEQTLAALKAQREQQQQTAGTSGLALIASTGNEIQNLTDRLRDSRAAEQDLREAASTAMQSQSFRIEAMRSQIDANIHSLARSTQGLQADIDYLANNNTGLSGQRDYVAELQARQAAQQVQIDALQNQKNSLAADFAARADAINGTVQARKQDLIAEQSGLREEIFSLRDEVARLEISRAEARMSLMSLNQQIAQTERSYAEQLKRVRALQAAAAP